MTSLQAVLLLSIGITLVAVNGKPFKPNCSSCKYFHGIGFIKHPKKCNVYFMCFKSPYTNYYRSQIMCCPEGTKFDDHHLTCKTDPKCKDPRDMCPNATTTTDLPCPLKKDPHGDGFIHRHTHEHGECPKRQYFSEEKCTCLFRGPYKRPCTKILHFKFNGSYDSFSCHNFAAGLPYGFPPANRSQLCLNGKKQYFQVPYLNNWFAWNPVARTWTLCFWLKVHPGETAGVFTTNCDNGKGDPIAVVWLDKGVLKVNLGGQERDTKQKPDKKWNLFCICFNRGHYTVFYNAVHVAQVWLKRPWKLKSHRDATLGWVHGKKNLKGYFSDFCFWTEYFFKPELKKLFLKGPCAAGETGTMPPFDPAAG